jgi:hypothetical protein
MPSKQFTQQKDSHALVAKIKLILFMLRCRRFRVEDFLEGGCLWPK